MENKMTLLEDLKGFSSFITQPLGLIDIGARGTLFEAVKALPKLIGAMAFEPDTEAANELEQSSKGSCNKVVVHPIALGEKAGRAELYCLTSSVNDSLRMPIQAFGDRYKLTNWTVKKSVNVALETLDHVVFAVHEKDQDFWGEFLKLDTQGTEFEILKGGLRTLEERTVAVVCETSFSELYVGQKLFGEVDELLRSKGFTFYGFLRDIYKSNRFLNKHKQIGSERMIQADAIYFKDPIENPKVKMSERQLRALFLSALSMKYYDFCIELAKKYFVDSDLDAVVDYVNARASWSENELRNNIGEFSNIVHNRPEIAAVALGKLVDRYKGSWNYDDIPAQALKKDQ